MFIEMDSRLISQRREGNDIIKNLSVCVPTIRISTSTYVIKDVDNFLFIKLAPKGQNILTQGEVLGTKNKELQALKGRNIKRIIAKKII